MYSVAIFDNETTGEPFLFCSPQSIHSLAYSLKFSHPLKILGQVMPLWNGQRIGYNALHVLSLAFFHRHHSSEWAYLSLHSSYQLALCLRVPEPLLQNAFPERPRPDLQALNKTLTDPDSYCNQGQMTATLSMAFPWNLWIQSKGHNAKKWFLSKETLWKNVPRPNEKTDQKTGQTSTLST